MMTDEQRFFDYMYRSQNPPDCARVRQVTTRASYFDKIGIGSQLISVKFNFISSLLAGSVYHFPSSHYVNPSTCSAQSLQCYFRSITECDSAGRVEEEVRWCDPVPFEKLSMTANLSRVRSQRWFHQRVSRFLFRPSDAIEDQVQRHSLDPGCLAIHVRQTDKSTEDHRKTTRQLGTYMHRISTWIEWNLATRSGELLVGSEDSRALNRITKRFQAVHRVRRIDKNLFVPMHFKNIGDFNRALKAVYARNKTSADEGQAMLVQTFAMARCRAFIGTFSSNIGIMVSDLSDGDAYDVDGRMYCGCGASFCMERERHALRDNLHRL